MMGQKFFHRGHVVGKNTPEFNFYGNQGRPLGGENIDLSSDPAVVACDDAPALMDHEGGDVFFSLGGQKFALRRAI